MTGVKGLEGAGIELLAAEFQVRPQGEDPSLHPEVGRRGLLIASGRDPQGFVLDHLKFVQMGGRYLGEPHGGSIVQDEAHDGLICGHQDFGHEAPARPS